MPSVTLFGKTYKLAWFGGWQGTRNGLIFGAAIGIPLAVIIQCDLFKTQRQSLLHREFSLERAYITRERMPWMVWLPKKPSN